MKIAGTETYNDILAAARECQKKRAEMMSDVDAALSLMFLSYTRLTELGWRCARYSPKDGSCFEVIEAGSTGIFRCRYEGTWPNGTYWVEDAGDLYASQPILFRPLTEEKS